MNRTSPLLFHPTQASERELETTFVGRWPLLEQLERDIIADASARSTRHWQLVGPRGSGKSHLTELLARRLIRAGWTVARLPEEHYAVGSVADLLEQIITRMSGAPSPFVLVQDVSKVEELSIAWLRDRREHTGKKTLVIIENLGILLERQLTQSREQSRLREVLMREPPFTLLATATSYIGATMEHSAPFYDFFQTLALEDFTREDVVALIEARARWDEAQDLLAELDEVKSRIGAIYHLSGGNPRLTLALYSILRQGVTADLHTQLLKLLDQVTPYYQARLSDISPQMVRVATEMVLAEGPLTPADIGRRCRMITNQITSNINKLVKERFVRPGARPDRRRRYYELNDRLFRLWMQMREDGTAQRRFGFLTEFFQHWYEGSPDEVAAVAARVTHEFSDSLKGGKPRRSTELFATFKYLRDALPKADPTILDSLLPLWMPPKASGMTARATRRTDKYVAEALRLLSHSVSRGHHPALVHDHILMVYVALLHKQRNRIEELEDWMGKNLDVASIVTSFSRTMPRLAKERPHLRHSIVEAFSRLRDRNQLPDDLLPYSVAAKVLAANDSAQELMALHPEVREAVTMILEPIERDHAPMSRVQHARRAESNARRRSRTHAQRARVQA